MISALTWSMPAMSAKVMRESLLVIISRRAPPNSLCNTIEIVTGIPAILCKATMLTHLLMLQRQRPDPLQVVTMQLFVTVQ